MCLLRNKKNYLGIILTTPFYLELWSVLYIFQILTSHAECLDSFFVQWALRCLPEDGKYKSVDISMPVDSNKVDAILSAFTSGTEINSRYQNSGSDEEWDNIVLQFYGPFNNISVISS